MTQSYDALFGCVYKGQGVLSTELTEECQCHDRPVLFMSMVFQEGSVFRH